ncbi:DUF5996 family protein [Streptosporangium sp. NPDC023963]|uniref:DUF5996 family protein n=1 Tax=Streptosporangium sp. NPDC023963 TaxID=3155608 RepID=UPI00343FA97A
MEKTITNLWPRLRVADWTETRDTLHMWTQIVGKIRMSYTPSANHCEEGAFYAYAYPEPPGYRERTEAYFDKTLQECVLPYEKVAESADPDATLLDFLRATYGAAADLAAWDRSAVEA